MDFAERSIQSELLRELADRYGGDGSALVLGDASLANSLPGSTALVRDLRQQEIATGPVLVDTTPTGFGSVLLPAPPNRDLLRRLILIAAVALEPDGKLLICGANAEGGKSAIKDAEAVFGPASWSGYREKHRMGIFRRGDVRTPDWSQTPGIAPGTWQEFAADLPTRPITLETQAGVFAGARLDAGTRLLLAHLEVAPGQRVLDIGCGVGVIGIAAGLAGATVTLTDANLLAVQAAGRNLARHGIDGVVLGSDVYSHLGRRRFDLIVTNPPFHQGKQVDLTVANRIIAEAPTHLHPGGSLLLVANAFLAYGKHMASVFDHVETIAATPQYHVLRGEIG